MIKPGPCPHVVATQEEVAKNFEGVGIAGVREWKRDGMPGSPGRYPLFEIALWRISRLKRHQGEPSGNGEGLKNPRARKDHFQAELARLKFETATGKLITSEAHEREVNAWSSWFVDALSQIPAAVASRVAGKNVTQAKRVLQAYCKGLRRKAFGEVKG